MLYNRRMNFFRHVFNPVKAESAVLIDIAPESVGGACVFYPKKGDPTIAYLKRMPIELHEGEAHSAAMERVLTELGESLIKDGAPALARHTGSGHAGSIHVSVDAPWQETSLHIERVEDDKPFVFTHRLATELAAKAGKTPPGKLVVDESVVGTILNGYIVHEPFDKKVTRATVVYLISYIDANTAHKMTSILRRLYHTEQVMPIAGASLRYQAIRAAFPHEKDALILDATASEASFSLIRGGILAAVTETRACEPGGEEWLSAVKSAFSELSSRYPLPRTLFLLARDDQAQALKERLGDIGLSSFWFSDDLPHILPVVATHLSGVKNATDSAPDLVLSLMALYGKQAL